MTDGIEITVGEFPVHNVGTVNGIDNTYDVHWLEEDLAELAIDGDPITTFATAVGDRFEDVFDVLNQAEDVVFDIENEDLLD